MAGGGTPASSASTGSKCMRVACRVEVRRIKAPTNPILFSAEAAEAILRVFRVLRVR
jgi:hypothetical protein